MKIFIYVFLFICVRADGQNLYRPTLNSLKFMLTGKTPLDFKQAVFSTENAFFDGTLSTEVWNAKINGLKNLAQLFRVSNELNYNFPDKEKIETYAAVFQLMTDTLKLILNKDTILNYPFQYNFDDVFGNNDWANMFVSTLMDTKRGNCHSLPYLYKIVCGELKVPCYLALSPNHIYIKLQAQKGGWYNTELTSASFPIDAWLMASGYVSLSAVQNGIYLDTLSEQQCIALCVLDLAQGFNRKYPDNDGTFVVECCDLALQYFPNYVSAILLKAEIRLKQLQAMQKQHGYAYLKAVTARPEGKTKWNEMNRLYQQLYQLGYRQMPEKMYLDWLISLKTEKEKYTNQHVPGRQKDKD